MVAWYITFIELVIIPMVCFAVGWHARGYIDRVAPTSPQPEPPRQYPLSHVRVLRPPPYDWEQEINNPW